jgi:hypothetical protein
MAKRELTPTEVTLNKIAIGLLGVVIFVLSFCLPIFAPVIFKILGRAIGDNVFLVRCAKAGAGLFLLCLLGLLAVLMFAVYRSGNMF